MSTAWLVARRELSEKLRSRAFWVVNAVLVVLLVAAAVLPVLLGGDGGPRDVTVAVVGDEAAAIAGTAAAIAADGDQLRLEVTPVDGRPAAEQALRDDEADLALVSADEVLALDEPQGRATELLESARRVTVLDEALAEAGVAADDRAALVAPAPLERTALDGDDAGPDPVATATGLTAVFVLYGLLIFYGQQIAQGIVQEKQSRVIEVLLATLRPVELLGGKLLGLGLLGLGQVAGLAVVGLGALAVSGRDAIPPAAVPTLLVTVAFFVLGYALYAVVFALAAAVVAKVEDLQTAMTIPILLLVGSFFLAQFALTDPDGPVALVGALLPPSAPIVQPLLVATGEAEAWVVVVGVAGVLATTAALVPVAARVHAGAALVTRSRISVRDALRRTQV